MEKYQLHWPALLFATLILPLSSCEKHMRLFQEKAQLEAELLKAQEESRLDEAKFATLGQPSAYAASALEQQIGIAEKDATALSLEVAALSSKVAALEQALTAYRPKVENFKSLQQKQP